MRALPHSVLMGYVVYWHCSCCYRRRGLPSRKPADSLQVSTASQDLIRTTVSRDFLVKAAIAVHAVEDGFLSW